MQTESEKETVLVPLNVQPFFDLIDTKTLKAQQAMELLRRFWIRSTRATNVALATQVADEVFVLKNKAQRRALAYMLADLARSACVGSRYIGAWNSARPDILEQTLDAMYLSHYVRRGYFMVAGGFLLRMLENPDANPLDIAREHDVDVFVSQHNVHHACVPLVC